ncbi:MAG: YitT family protein [Lachnospiraceae bacterium]|nr:YitT family protein [Lachnospiraceae bacterium]MBQ2106527.1 YitT family protein [Lachnospiraceae bacterium]
MTEKDKNVSKLIKQVSIIIVGLTIYAFGLAVFVLPTDMIAAGTTGMALLAQRLWGIPISTFVAVFNVLMFGLGFLELGKTFALTTLVATFYYPVILDVAIAVVGDMVITQDPMLCAIFSGIIIGFSLGIVIKAGASTGGMDIPPLVLKKRFSIPVSASMYFFDAVILVGQMPFGDKERILYALIMVMVYTMVLDKVLMMGSKQIQVKIFSAKYEEISRAIQEKMDRGTTLLNMEGGHSRQKSMAILSIVSGRELSKINDIVMEIDENAFMIVNQVGEVRGRGFTMTKKYE